MYSKPIDFAKRYQDCTLQKGQAPQEVVWEPDYPCPRERNETQLSLHTKVSSSWMKDLDVRAKLQTFRRKHGETKHLGTLMCINTVGR